MECSCGAAPGKLHDLFCPKEACPFCAGQLASCSCIETVLALTPSEIQAVHEYIDDSVEPLQSVMERWRAALEQKGRVPWTPPLDPPRPQKREKIDRIGLKREPGFLYQLTDRAIYRAPREPAPRSAADWTKIYQGSFTREEGWAYAIDLDGDIVRFRRS
jgi:hypothetical protein